MEGRLSGEKHQGGLGNVDAGVGVKKAMVPININAIEKKVSRILANNICI
jgi:hypothetical protein